MRITLVGHDFDFTGNDGISRYSFELYMNLLKHAADSKKRYEVDKIGVADLPLFSRALRELEIRDRDIIHLVYPNPIGIVKSMSKLLITWHDNRVFTRSDAVKLLSRHYYREKSVKRIALENYRKCDGIISVSSKTQIELKEYLFRHGIYSDSKRYFVVNEGIDDKFLKQRVWHGERKDFGYIGAIHQTHKNLPGLLEVFDGVAKKAKDSKLHIFTLSQNAAEILARGMRGHANLSKKNVILHHRAPDSEILAYLPKLAGYLHLSIEEGFGLPIMESFATGTPVLMLEKSDIPEEVSRYAFRGSPGMIVDEALRAMESQKPASPQAIRYARSFTWKKTALGTMEVYRQMLG